MTAKSFLPLLVAGAIGGAVTYGAIRLSGYERDSSNTPAYSRIDSGRAGRPSDMPDNFGEAVENSLQQVVHIQATGTMQHPENQEYYQLPEPFRHFFGIDPYLEQRPPMQREQAGSGVIISEDGFIVTNLHVIDQTQEIQVSLNDRRVLKAKLVGADPSTDLALLKIDGKDLPFIRFADSDKVMVGDWVVAVGNPFNLASTVTAGIVSAKARTINVLRTEDNSAIESFIQTDAAVNPGNSGGALVNLKGELVGINTAIATPTGVYAGYAFAVPSNIVAKVIEDIRKHGKVQRGFLGVSIRELDWETAKKLKLKSSAGVVVETVLKGSAAAAAGLQAKDVILEVNDKPVASTAEFMGVLAQHRPGDKLTMEVLRGRKTRNMAVKLMKEPGREALLAEGRSRLLNQLGIELEPLSGVDKRRYGLRSGVLVSKVVEGKAAHLAGIQAGFVITRLDRQPVNSVQDVIKAIQNLQGGVLMEGVYPGRPEVYYYALGMQ